MVSFFNSTAAWFKVTLICLILAAFAGSCTDLNTDKKQHGDAWTDIESPYFHGAKIAETGLLTCQYCHGEDFKGGEADFSCSQSACHVEEQGVKSCNTCHGIQTDSTFKNLWPHRGGSNQEIISAQTHASHVLGLNNLRSPLECSECHFVPDSLFAPYHILENNFTAEINFSSLATGEGAEAIWDADSKSCSNIYCHGNFSAGNKKEVNWLSPVAMECNFCHNSPPDNHPAAYTDCSVCHSSVINDDNESIKDLTKHINGIINF